MNIKALAIAVFAFTILFFGGNLAASRLAFNPKTCDCAQLEDLVGDVSNAVYIRGEFRKKLKELRKLDEETADREFKEFVARLHKEIEAPKCYRGPAAVEFIPWGRRIPFYSLGKYKDEALCKPSDTSLQDLEAAKRGACCEADAAATDAHETFHKQKCLGIGYKDYHEMGSADLAAEEAEAYTRQISVYCATLKKMSCPKAPKDVLIKLRRYCP